MLERFKQINSVVIATALALSIGAIPVAQADDGLFAIFFKMFGEDVKDDSACAKILAGADTITDKKASPLAGRLLDRVFGKHHTVLNLQDPSNGLSVAGISGKFLGPPQIDGLKTEANRILEKILEDGDLADHLGRQMIRLGMLANSEKQPDFAKFFVLAHNKIIDLKDPKIDEKPIENDVIRSYLDQLHLRIKKTHPEDSMLSPVEASQRLKSLLNMVQAGFSDLDPNEKEASMRSFDMALVEVGKLETAGQLTSGELDRIFDQLIGSSIFKFWQINIPEWVRAAAGFVPYSSVLFKIWDLANNAYYKESQLSSVRHEVRNVDIWHKRAPKTLQIRFRSSDIKNLKPVVNAFFEHYLSVDRPSVFDDSFANWFLTAYPEVVEYFSSFYSNEQLPQHPIAKDAFANYHPEIQKLLIKAANFFSILREDRAVFQVISGERLTELHQNMVAELGLQKTSGELDFERIDRFFTVFVTNSLGKAHSPVIDSIADDFQVTERAGHYDYNRRALFLLNHYRTLSYSFSRQPEDAQNFIISVMDSNFQAALESILRLEAPEASFKLLHQVKPEVLYFLFYQHLLAESKESAHHLTIAPNVLDTWVELKNLVIEATKPGESTGLAYQKYTAWLSAGTDLDLSRDWDRVVLRVAALMGIPGSQTPLVKNAMQQMWSEADRAVAIQLLVRASVFLYRAADLFKAVLVANGEKNISFEKSVADYVLCLNRVFATIQSNGPIWARVIGSRTPSKVFLRPIIEKLQEPNMDVESLCKMTFSIKHYSYGDVVHVDAAAKD